MNEKESVGINLAVGRYRNVASKTLGPVMQHDPDGQWVPWQQHNALVLALTERLQGQHDMTEGVMEQLDATMMECKERIAELEENSTRARQLLEIIAAQDEPWSMAELKALLKRMRK